MARVLPSNEGGSKSAVPDDARSVRFNSLTTPNSAHSLNVVAKHAPELKKYEQLLP
jgi:hypothetical protein